MWPAAGYMHFLSPFFLPQCSQSKLYFVAAALMQTRDLVIGDVQITLLKQKKLSYPVETLGVSHVLQATIFITM